MRRRHIISTVEDIQYRCVTPSVRRRHIISTVKGVKYGGGYATRTCHIVSTEEGVQCRTTKTAQGVVGSRIYLGK